MQKDEAQSAGYEKTKHTKFSEKLTFLTPWYAHVRVWNMGQKMLVFQKIWCALFSCNLGFEICPFTLLPTIKDVMEVPLKNATFYRVVPSHRYCTDFTKF